MSELAELLALGISHKTAPVALRERLSLPAARVAPFLAQLTGDPEVYEAVAISTCNRTELYLVASDPVEAETVALGMLARQGEIRPTELSGSIYSLRNCDAARHLHRVAAGLESMVIGEHEVQGQVKRAYETALEAGATGPLTNRLFRAALATGKRVRAETQIAAGRVSLSSMAVELAGKTIGDLRGRSVVVLGTGETSELTAAALADRGAEMVFVANRRRERAREVARRFGGRTVGIEDLPEELAAADIMLAATASPHPIVTAEDLELVVRSRSERPLLLIDLALPRDVDPLCAEVPGVELLDLDDLQASLARTRSGRRGEARVAEAIVEEEIQSFARWLGSLEVLPTIAALRRHGDAIVDGVLAENRGRWEHASERDLERVAAVARAVMKRLLHEPTRHMRRPGEDGLHGRMQLLRELFGLEDEPAAAEPLPEAQAHAEKLGEPEPAASVRRIAGRRPSG